MVGAAVEDGAAVAITLENFWGEDESFEESSEEEVVKNDEESTKQESVTPPLGKEGVKNDEESTKQGGSWTDADGKSWFVGKGGNKLGTPGLVPSTVSYGDEKKQGDPDTGQGSRPCKTPPKLDKVRIFVTKTRRGVPRKFMLDKDYAEMILGNPRVQELANMSEKQAIDYIKRLEDDYDQVDIGFELSEEMPGQFGITDTMGAWGYPPSHYYGYATIIFKVERHMVKIKLGQEVEAKYQENGEWRKARMSGS